MSMKEILASREEKLPYGMHCFMTQVTLLPYKRTEWLPSCKPSVLPTDKPGGDKNKSILANCPWAFCSHTHYVPFSHPLPRLTRSASL